MTHHALVEDVTALHLGPLRWRERRQRHRPAGEPFAAARHGVEVLDRSAARDFVARHHYARTCPPGRLSVGLYRSRRAHVRGLSMGAELVGVAVFSVPMQPAAGRLLAPDLEPSAVVELGRLVLLDHVEGNGESFLVGRALRLLAELRPEVRLVVSYSDPVIRRDAAGVATLPGHVGTIYQATNARYTGRSEPRTVWLAPDGTSLSGRSLTKLRKGEAGAAPYADLLRAYGAPRQRHGESSRAWVARALAEGPFRALPHPGCHRYGWRLDGVPVAGPRPPEGAPRRRGLEALGLVAVGVPHAA